MWLAVWLLFTFTLYYVLPFLLDVDEKYYRSVYRLGDKKTRYIYYIHKKIQSEFHRKYIPSILIVLLLEAVWVPNCCSSFISNWKKSSCEEHMMLQVVPYIL